MNIGRHLTGYDPCDIVESEVKFRFEECNEEGQTKEEIKEQLFNDSDLFQNEWEYICDYLTEIIKKKNPDGYWKAKVNNFGWRNLDGVNCFVADTGKDLLSAILPDCDCVFKIFNYGKGIAIQNSHHDSPMGNEWYYITPCKFSTYEKFN